MMLTKHLHQQRLQLQLEIQETSHLELDVLPDMVAWQGELGRRAKAPLTTDDLVHEKLGVLIVRVASKAVLDRPSFTRTPIV
eukprot:5261040-Amphidinium_carterae.1